MHQTFRLTLGMVFILTLTTGEALAQYYGGYGGWGGETPEGNFARGAGFYELGAGVYNRDTAIANSIEQELQSCVGMNICTSRSRKLTAVRHYAGRGRIGAPSTRAARSPSGSAKIRTNTISGTATP